MSKSYIGVNMKATAIANLPFNQNRRYLAVVAIVDVTVTISGGEPFILVAGSVWSPIPAPINDIVLAGTGTMIVG